MGWCVDYGVRDGKRRREYFADLDSATAAYRSGTKAARELGRAWLGLQPALRLDLMEVMREIQSRGLTVREVWEAYLQGPTAAPAPTNGKKLGEAIADLIQSKTQLNKRPAYIASLEQYLKAWAKGMEARPIAAIDHHELESFVLRQKALSSQTTAINRLTTLFSFALRKGWVSENPCKRLERPTIEDRPPEILTLDETRKILKFTKAKLPHFQAWLALTLFGGLRPEEAEKITWDKVDKKAGTVLIDASVSKVRNERTVHLKPVAVAWLKRGGDLPLTPAVRRRAIRKLREVLKWPVWKKDVLRHTAASNWIADVKSYGAVALELGNSETMLRKHYKRPVSDADAKRFWALTPEAVAKK